MSHRAVTSESQIDQVAALAHEIWYEYYVPIIGRAQVDYMVAKFQSAAAIREQLGQGYEYFLLDAPTTAGAVEPVGYLAVRAERDALFVSKLYLLARARGTGAGRRALDFIEARARDRGCRRVWLTVNKDNPARHVYERHGFVCAEAIVTDIGGGFVMDDYLMEKFLA